MSSGNVGNSYAAFSSPGVVLITTEEAKRRILDYLEAACGSWNGQDYRAFTYQAIVDALEADSRKSVDKALESLKEEGNLKALSLHIEAYVPANKTGNHVARGLVESSHGMGSWIPAVVLSMVIIYAFLVRFPFSPSEEVEIDSIAHAYQEGVLSGVFLMGVFGLLLAAFLHWVWTAYQRSALMHEENHRAIVWVTKISMVPALILVGAYLGLVQYYDRVFSPAAALGLFAAGFPIGWGYTKLIQDRQDRPA